MNRSRRDIDDLDNLFDQDEAKRRRQQREHDRTLAAERGVMLDEQDRILRERARAAFVGTNEAMILAGYRAAGLEPRTGNGVVLVSLQTLLSIGWRIEELPHGIKTLVAPPTPEKYVARGECS